MKKSGKILVTAVLMGTMLLGAGCGGAKTDTTEKKNDQGAQTTQGDQSAPTEKKTYVVGTEPTFAPFEFQDDDGNMSGFDLDLIKAIGEDQGFEVTFKSLGFDALTAEIQNGSIDIIASGMSISEDRKEVVDFSDPYIDADLSVVVADDNETIKGLGDLKGMVLAAQTGTTGADQCQALLDDGTAKDFKSLADYNLCMLELGTGGVDAVINDIPVTKAYMLKEPGKIKIVGDPIESASYGFAVNKDAEELLGKINTGLANVKANGVYDEISAKYFGKTELVAE